MNNSGTGAMSFSDYYRNYYRSIFDRVYITESASHLAPAVRAAERVGLPVFGAESEKDVPPEHLNSRTLLVTSRKGETVGKCPGTRKHICCNYITIDLYTGCTLGCSYCIMKSYLNFAPVKVYADSKPAIEELRKIALLNRDRIVRAGTGEVGDSLQFDPLFEMTEEFISSLSDLDNFYFEAKTKTCFVDHLLDIGKKGNAVIGFSLNPDTIAREEEKDAFTIEERLYAAEKAAAAGYNLSFHFDPVICMEGWEELYLGTAEMLSRFDRKKIKWISIGTLRYPPALKDKIGDRPYIYDEFVSCADGKYRYMQKRRKEAYLLLYEKLRKVTGSSVYFCMENSAVWNYAAGGVPGSLESARWLFRKVRGVRSRYQP